MNLIKYITEKFSKNGKVNPYIYYIKCSANNKIYIGMTVSSTDKRWSQHLHSLRVGTHVNYYLQEDFIKYGEDNFTFGILEYVEPNAVHLVEKMWIKSYKEFECYNIVNSKRNKRGNIW